jgi:hypothetical protein
VYGEDVSGSGSANPRWGNTKNKRNLKMDAVE